MAEGICRFIILGKILRGIAAVKYRLTRAVLGGFTPPPQAFREYLKKNGRAASRRFWYTCLCIFSAHVVEISDPGHSRSGHQVTSIDITSEKV